MNLDSGLLQLYLNLQITGSRKRPTKPGFFLSAGMHAREWIAPATLIYIAGQVKRAPVGVKIYIFLLFPTRKLSTIFMKSHCSNFFLVGIKINVAILYM